MLSQISNGAKSDAVANELEKLRNHYSNLKKEKKVKEEIALKKALNASASDVQKRLSQVGIDKLSALKIRDQPSPIRSNSRSKVANSPVCDRLYKQGMERVRQRSLSRQREDEQQATFSTVKTDVRPNQTAERLYTEGLVKMRARSRSRSISNRVPRQRSNSRSNMIPTKSMNSQMLPPRGRSPFSQRC